MPSFDKLISIAIGLLLVNVVAGVRATTVVIDAEQFAVGDGLDQVNAVAEPLGVVLDAFHSSSFQVGLDSSGDKAFQVLPEGGRADMVANFARAAEFVRITFGSIDHTRASYLGLYDGRLFPAGPFEGFLESRIHVGSGDVALEYSWPLSGTPSQVRAALLEQDIAQPHSVYVRAIEVRLVQANLLGDIDLDRDVDRTDAALFATHLGAGPGGVWTTGDFNGDEVTTLADMFLLQGHLGESLPQLSPSASATAVPESGTLTLAVPMLAGFFARSRHGKRSAREKGHSRMTSFMTQHSFQR